MKKIISTLLLCLPALIAVGQNAQVKVQYKATAPVWHDPDKPSTKTMLLLAGPDGSKYFNEMSQYVDSLTSTPEGEKQLREIQMKAWVTQNPDGSITVNKNNGNAPQKSVKLYVVKNNPEATVTVYDEWALESGVYTEPFDELTWTVVEDSTKNVLGYECILGEADYHGRHWKAWFTPEIPVQDGPWKLRGLPGLILLAETPGTPFKFEATGIEATDEPIPPMYKTAEYGKVERKKALEQEEWGINNRSALLNAKYGGGVKVRTEAVGVPKKKSSTPIKFVKESHAIESDY